VLCVQLAASAFARCRCQTGVGPHAARGDLTWRSGPTLRLEHPERRADLFFLFLSLRLLFGPSAVFFCLASGDSWSQPEAKKCKKVKRMRSTNSLLGRVRSQGLWLGYANTPRDPCICSGAYCVADAAQHRVSRRDGSGPNEGAPWPTGARAIVQCDRVRDALIPKVRKPGDAN
jgi:hypothetical protein